MLYLILIILFVAWFLGYFVLAAGTFIHLLLVVVLIIILYRLLTGGKL